MTHVPAAYLSRFVRSIQEKNQVLFPSKSQTYNYRGKNGTILPVRICLVGIVTCEDDIGRNSGSSSMNTILNLLGENRFRMTDPSSSTRLLAYQQAFASVNIRLSQECIEALPILAAKAASARGRIFSKTANTLRSMMEEGEDMVSMEQMEKAMQKCLNIGIASSTAFNAVSFQSTVLNGSEDQHGVADMFTSVGGNIEAKRALLAALALDERKRRLMALCGMSTPSGVLLYGPPGT